MFLPIFKKNIKPLRQLESGFKGTINWNKYHSKKLSQPQNRYLNVLIDPSFQGVNRLFVLSFECDDGQKSYKQYYLPILEVKDYNVLIDGRNFFDQPIKTDLKTYDNIRKMATGLGDDSTNGCLLDSKIYYFKKYYKLIGINLSKQQKLGADPKAIQQINFTGNLTRGGGARMYFIIEKAKETVLDFSKETVKLLCFNKISI